MYRNKKILPNNKDLFVDNRKEEFLLIEISILFLSRQNLENDESVKLKKVLAMGGGIRPGKTFKILFTFTKISHFC